MKFELKKTLKGASDEEVLEDLRSAAALLGKDTITMNEYAEVGMGHSSSVRRRFGSWFRALELAGLQPSRSKIGISNDELFDNLRGLWILLGRQPSYSEIKKPDSKYSAGTYEKRFGSWTKSLEAFINWINSDEDQEPSTEKYSSDSIKQTKASKKHRTRREVSDRMRFRILLRDGFSCKSCGASPLKSQGVELHVDHILPWSKGGETVEDNLQAKCSKCNLGKGNAFTA